jgi:repressor LexA
MLADQRRRILQFYEHERRMPSFAEVANLVGFRSKNAAAKLVAKLVAEGTVRQDATGRLVPAALERGLPLLGLVEAGLPTAAEAEMLETLEVGEWLGQDRPGQYLLRIRGDSMIEAGIHEGDLVLADTTKRAKPGDIVIAEADGGWTVKYLRERRGRQYLAPANKRYREIHPTESLRVGAVVRAVLRRYGA